MGRGRSSLQRDGRCKGPGVTAPRGEPQELRDQSVWGQEMVAHRAEVRLGGACGCLEDFGFPEVSVLLQVRCETGSRDLEGLPFQLEAEPTQCQVYTPLRTYLQVCPLPTPCNPGFRGFCFTPRQPLGSQALPTTERGRREADGCDRCPLFSRPHVPIAWPHCAPERGAADPATDVPLQRDLGTELDSRVGGSCRG